MSTPPERPGDAQAQRLFSRSTYPSLGLVEAASLFSYLTMRDADDRDVPAAAAIRVKRGTDFYLGPVLMELALHGRLHMDRPTPLENYAYAYRQRQLQRSGKLLWFVVPPLVLFIAGIITFFQNAHQQLASLFFLGFGAYIIVLLLLLLVIGFFSKDKRVQANLAVMNPTPTGNGVLDAVLWQMLSTGESRQVYRWLYGRGALKADGLYKITEGRLVEHGWITLTGKQRVLGLVEVETLVINRQTEQWQALSEQLRSALLLEDTPSPYMVALLLCLTLLTETFVTPRHLRFPGQPAKRKMVSSLYQFLSSPEELTIARQRLQALMQGDQAIAAAIGFPLYDTLLSIRNGVEESVEAKRSSSG
jgi:hypothetical protein